MCYKTDFIAISLFQKGHKAVAEISFKNYYFRMGKPRLMNAGMCMGLQERHIEAVSSFQKTYVISLSRA